LQVLHETFPHHAFLMNGLIQGVKVGRQLFIANTSTDQLISNIATQLNVESS